MVISTIPAAITRQAQIAPPRHRNEPSVATVVLASLKACYDGPMIAVTPLTDLGVVHGLAEDNIECPAGEDVVVLVGSMKAGSALMHTVLAGPAGLYMGRRSSYAYITFADGTFRKTEIRGKSAWRAAQQEALEFNLLAKAA